MNIQPVAQADRRPTEGFVRPMLATPMPVGSDVSTFATSAWAMEEKFDGHRVVIVVGSNGEVTGWSRPRGHEAPLRRALPTHIVDVLETFPWGTYDGELIVPGGKSFDVTCLSSAGRHVLVVFDVLRLLGDDVTRDSYAVRRGYLASIGEVRGGTAVRLSESGPVSAARVKAIWTRGGEGAILKRLAAPYQAGARSKDWIKVKACATDVLTVVGYEAGKCGPYSKVVLRDATGRETTVKTLDARELRNIAENPASYVGRKLRIEFQELTPDGRYRHGHWDRWEDV